MGANNEPLHGRSITYTDCSVSVLPVQFSSQTEVTLELFKSDKADDDSKHVIKKGYFDSYHDASLAADLISDAIIALKEKENQTQNDN